MWAHCQQQKHKQMEEKENTTIASKNYQKLWKKNEMKSSKVAEYLTSTAVAPQKNGEKASKSYFLTQEAFLSAFANFYPNIAEDQDSDVWAMFPCPSHLDSCW